MRRILPILAAAFAALATAAAAQDRPVVKTASGPVRGVVEDGNDVFRGIPFAASTAGEGRWAPPRAPAPWTAPRDAADFGPICIQGGRPDGVLAAGAGRPQSEDCLFLNVWAPKAARGAPVMVWIHGGAHRFGSGTGPIYDGAAFARDGVVLVTINYRLGAFGYFAHPALTRAAKPTDPLASYGLMDQMAALAWVKKNIAAFGGDPKNVTVFGESAGGSSILALMATPTARGLFDKAIVESGGGWQGAPSLAQAEQAGIATIKAAGLPGADATLAEMRALPPEKLVSSDIGSAAGVGPIADGRLLPQSPTKVFAEGKAVDVPLIIGSNSYEASLMKTFHIDPALAMSRLKPEQRALYEGDGDLEHQAADAFTDIAMGAPARWVAARESGGAPAWLYHFSYVASMRRSQLPGASHGSEIIYVFETGSKIAARFASDEDKAMEARMHACWVAFAKTGAPACGGQAWPAYTPRGDQLMEFGVKSGVETGFRKAFMDAAEKARGE